MTSPVAINDRVFVYPAIDNKRRQVMKSVLIVWVTMIGVGLVKDVLKKRNRKIVNTDPITKIQVQHPAEFQLR